MVTEKAFSDILEAASQMAKIESGRCAQIWVMNRTQTDFFPIADQSKDLMILTTDTLTEAESNVVSKAIQRYSTCLMAVIVRDGSVGSLLKVARLFRQGSVIKVGGVKPPRESVTATKQAVAWFDEEQVY